MKSGDHHVKDCLGTCESIYSVGSMLLNAKFLMFQIPQFPVCIFLRVLHHKEIIVMNGGWVISNMSNVKMWIVSYDHLYFLFCLALKFSMKNDFGGDFQVVRSIDPC